MAVSEGEVGSKVEVRILELDERPLLVILMVREAYGLDCGLGGRIVCILGMALTLDFPVCQPLVNDSGIKRVY